MNRPPESGELYQLSNPLLDHRRCLGRSDSLRANVTPWIIEVHGSIDAVRATAGRLCRRSRHRIRLSAPGLHGSTHRPQRAQSRVSARRTGSVFGRSSIRQIQIRWWGAAAPTTPAAREGEGGRLWRVSGSPTTWLSAIIVHFGSQSKSSSTPKPSLIAILGEKSKKTASSSSPILSPFFWPPRYCPLSPLYLGERRPPRSPPRLAGRCNRCIRKAPSRHNAFAWSSLVHLLSLIFFSDQALERHMCGGDGG